MNSYSATMQSPKTSWVSVNGVLTRAADAQISPFDRGFLFADAVYEVTRTVHGRLLFWPAHADRLWRSAAAMDIQINIERTQLNAELDALIKMAPTQDLYIRVVITRGVGDGSLERTAAGPPTRVLYALPMPRVPAELGQNGCVLRTYRSIKITDRSVKSGDRREATRARGTASARGAYEALRVDTQGHIVEGATSTFFAVVDGRLLTAPVAAGVLEGITRAQIFKIAERLGLPIGEGTVPVAALATLSEAFITSSVRGVVPVRQIDEVVLGPPGPITKQVVDAYATALSEPPTPRDGRAE